MKAVIAIDSFKGSLSSVKAGAAVARAIKEVYPDAVTSVLPIADGGEGTVDALVSGLSGRSRTVTVTGPLGEKTDAVYGIVDKTAVIEMAAAAGLPLVPEDKRNPLSTTTYGVGELILDAIDCGCRSFIIGIGGSATNDGGTGMLKALGYELLDAEGRSVADGAIGLEGLKTIKTDNVRPELSICDFKVASDVKNPLLGELGCSAVFGPQKGADKATVERMDKALANFLEVSKSVCPNADGEYPGSGAAGGLGFAFRSFLGAELTPGIELILNSIGIENEVKDADIVITGEGRLDSQTVMGKAPAGVARAAKKYGVPVIAFSGAVTEDANLCNEGGIDAFFPILQRVCTLSEAMDEENAYSNLKNTAKQVFLLLKRVKGF